MGRVLFVLILLEETSQFLVSRQNAVVRYPNPDSLAVSPASIFWIETVIIPISPIWQHSHLQVCASSTRSDCIADLCRNSLKLECCGRFRRFRHATLVHLPFSSSRDGFLLGPSRRKNVQQYTVARKMSDTDDESLDMPKASVSEFIGYMSEVSDDLQTKVCT